MNGMDLFSGIGGISLALRDYVRPIAYCEIDPYCQGVLLSRMADESLRNGPIWDDIKTLDGNIFEGAIDIIYGGFPCQDISVAGHGKGLAGERSGLFFEIVRLCREIKPRFLFLENVPAITSRGGTEVVREISSLGYDCRWCIISAASVGAMHKRERWFLLAKSRCQRFCERPEEVQPQRIQPKQQNIDELCWGKTEPDMGRKANGIPFQLDRIKGLGNSVCPQQVKKAFEILMGIK
jgi:DNA (cytosine-5)-methyltransferase 1